MKLYIIRHAETEYNRKGIIQGSEVDSDINDVGESQANSFYEYYKNINFEIKINVKNQAPEAISLNSPLNIFKKT